MEYRKFLGPFEELGSPVWYPDAAHMVNRDGVRRIWRNWYIPSRASHLRPSRQHQNHLHEMITRFRLMVAATDFLGQVNRHEMTVIAANDEEVRQEIESFFALRDVTDSWEIVEFLEKQPLSNSDPHMVSYREQGPHSYH